jgi:transposase
MHALGKPGKSDERFQLHSWTLGALPILNAFLDRLGVDELLARALPADSRATLAPATALGVLLRAIAEGRGPLYQLSDWVAERDPDLLGLDPEQRHLLNDDRLGRALDRLFDADRAALQIELVLNAIRRFDIATDEFHNDSTTITFSGIYEERKEKPPSTRSSPDPAKITYGHNKDHRNDLKQLLWILTVSADEAVPILGRVADGNTEDSQTHRQTWDTLRALVGRSDFLYVADSKLCTRENMDHIDRHGGRFLTVLPRSRKEDELFREWLQDHQPDWLTVREELGRDRQPELHLMTEAPWPSADGYRVVWVLSSAKARRDAHGRQERIVRASRQLDQLAERMHGPKTRIRTRQQAQQAVSAILHESGCEAFFETTVNPATVESYQQDGPGRPGPDTRYRRRQQARMRLSWTVRPDQVARQARSDGMFPLITNCRQLSLAELLDHYKYQPRLERRHEQLKSGLLVAPVWLKKPGRIEALLFLYFVALLVRALIEREVRRQMRSQGLRSLPIYPEARECSAPTAERILALFAGLQRHDLLDSEQIVDSFHPDLTNLQRRLVTLLGLPLDLYRSDD